MLMSWPTLWPSTSKLLSTFRFSLAYGALFSFHVGRPVLDLILKKYGEFSSRIPHLQWSYEGVSLQGLQPGSLAKKFLAYK